MNAVEFLIELWTPNPPGLILTWELSSKHSHYFKAPAGVTSIAPGTPDVYTGVGLAHESHGKHRRTANDKVVAIPGLWADIDVIGGPDKKLGAAPDRDAAIELAGELLEPTVVVDSGYGIQAWWLFAEPWRFQTIGDQRQAAQVSAQWQKLLRDGADFGLDYTHDLARILRLPGTSNAKGAERKAVTVIATGPRYERGELLEHCKVAGDVDPGVRFGESGHHADVSCRPDTSIEHLDDLIAHSPKFRRTWNHDRDDLPSMSEHDMALASIAALAGWTDQQIADLVCVHRRTNDPQDPKASRVDYVRRTVKRSRLQEQPEMAPQVVPQAKGSLDADGWGSLIFDALQAADDGAIPLPFRGLTEAMDGGLRPGEVCLVAGYTGDGKSILVDQIADRAAAAGRRVHLYLTEMTAYQRGLRLLARRAHVEFKSLRRRDLDTEQWEAVAAELALMPYGCSVVADWTVEDVVAHIVQNKWDLVVVDLIHGFHYQDERDLSKTSSALVRAAKASAGADFAGTTIVCAAHLNDGQMRDQRSPKRPMPGLHSIKGSSSLKQDADTVLFVWRESDEMGIPEHDGVIWIGKSRQGGMGAIDVELDVGRMEFVERPQVTA
jgi:DnaB-like helicase C terminal domain